jgi:aminoglycoside phosphotransferase
MEVAEVVEQLWPGAAASIELLDGRPTTRRYRVLVPDGAFVVRVGSLDAVIDERAGRIEYDATLAAAAVGIGPPVVTYLDEHDCLVTRFLHGKPLDAVAVRMPRAITAVAHALRVIHGGPPLGRRFDPYRAVEELRSTAFTHGVDVPSEYAWARQVARRIEVARGPAPERPCHNDLLRYNVVEVGPRLVLVDWARAGMGDVLFDLAVFSTANELSADDRRVLLEAYFDAPSENDRRALELMRFMAEFREAMWSVAQASTGVAAADFGELARLHFARLIAIADEPGFTDALAG